MTRIIELPADEFPQWLESLVFEWDDASEPTLELIPKKKDEGKSITAVSDN